MAFVYCQSCRRYFNDRAAHDCPARPVAALASTEKVKPSWPPPWYIETAADRAIAKKFKNVKTANLW